jgi:hypothetical protein
MVLPVNPVKRCIVSDRLMWGILRRGEFAREYKLINSPINDHLQSTQTALDLPRRDPLGKSASNIF